MTSTETRNVRLSSNQSAANGNTNDGQSSYLLVNLCLLLLTDDLLNLLIIIYVINILNVHSVGAPLNWIVCVCVCVFFVIPYYP